MLWFSRSNLVSFSYFISVGILCCTECQIIRSVIWSRLSETEKNWHLVYKAVVVIEYLVAHGSERAVDDVVEHTFQISALARFEYVEPNGKDQGINITKKGESTVVALLNIKDKLHEGIRLPPILRSVLDFHHLESHTSQVQPRLPVVTFGVVNNVEVLKVQPTLKHLKAVLRTRIAMVKINMRRTH